MFTEDSVSKKGGPSQPLGVCLKQIFGVQIYFNIIGSRNTAGLNILLLKTLHFSFHVGNLA